MSTATKSAVPLFSKHTGASITSRKARLIGQAFSFANLSTTAARVPSAPPQPTLVRATGGLFELILQSPNDTGGIPMQDFQVFMNGKKLDGDLLDKSVTKAGLQITTQISVGGLVPLTNYTFQIVAVNALSVCSFDEVAKSEALNLMTTAISPPGVPQIARVRETGAGISLRLIDPRDNGGSDIKRYTLYYMLNGSTDDSWSLGYSGSAYEAVVASLKSSRTYAFRLSVNNGFFESANSSNFVRSTTAVSAPGACVEPKRVAATGGMLNVSWELPVDDGGSEILDYIVTLSLDADGSGKKLRIVSDRYFTFYGLLPSTAYRVVVRARNTIDKGPESNPVTFTTSAGSPPAGPIDIVVLKTSGGAVVISFNEPADLGGSNSLDIIYRVFVNDENRLNLTSDDLANARASVSSSTSRRLTETSDHRRLAALSFSGVVVGGLDPEELYGIEIVPVSAFGSGKSTEPVSAATTTPTVSSPPLALTLDQATGGSLTMAWEPPVDTGGVPLEGFALYLATVSGAGPFALACTEAQTLCMIDGLSPSTAYWFYVVARNDVGDSMPTATVRAQTQTITAPNSPLNVRITMFDDVSVECAWDPPADLGGSSIVSYTVLVQSLDGTITRPATATTTSSTVDGLAPSVPYSIVLVRLCLHSTAFVWCECMKLTFHGYHAACKQPSWGHKHPELSRVLYHGRFSDYASSSSDRLR